MLGARIHPELFAADRDIGRDLPFNDAFPVHSTSPWPAPHILDSVSLSKAYSLLYRVRSKRQQLKDLLPDFLALYSENGSQPFVQLFQGPYAAREVYEDILATAKKRYSYFSPSQLTLQVVDRTYIQDWVRRRVKKGIQSRSLRVKAQDVVGEPLFNQETEYLRQIRYLPSHVDLKASIYIYEKNIGVISTIKEGTAFIIHSTDLSFSFQQIFDFLWSISKES